MVGIDRSLKFTQLNFYFLTPPTPISFFSPFSSPSCHHPQLPRRLHYGVPSLSTLSNTALEHKLLLSFLLPLLSMLLIVYFDNLMNAMNSLRKKMHPHSFAFNFSVFRPPEVLSTCHNLRTLDFCLFFSLSNHGGKAVRKFKFCAEKYFPTQVPHKEEPETKAENTALHWEV